MQATDRASFGKLAEALFAAFDKPPSDGRLEAYWRGLKGMDLLAFERTIDVVIGPDGEDELPTPKQLYAIDRKRRAELRAAEMAGRKKPGDEEPKTDRFDDYAGRVLFCVLCSLTAQHGSGATEESLTEMIHVKHRFAKGYREQFETDPDSTLEMRDALIAALTARFVPREPSNDPNHKLTVPAPGETWRRALDAIDETRGPMGHNAPPGSPVWTAALPGLR